MTRFFISLGLPYRCLTSRLSQMLYFSLVLKSVVCFQCIQKRSRILEVIPRFYLSTDYFDDDDIPETIKNKVETFHIKINFPTISIMQQKIEIY